MSGPWCRDYFPRAQVQAVGWGGVATYGQREPDTTELARLLVAAAADLMPRAQAALAAELRLGGTTGEYGIRCEAWNHALGTWHWSRQDASSGQRDHWHVALWLPGASRRRWAFSAYGLGKLRDACTCLGWPFEEHWRAQP